MLWVRETSRCAALSGYNKENRAGRKVPMKALFSEGQECKEVLINYRDLYK
ncbi:hypothetical protein [Cyclobacterium qasimii]|uniref:hypothetical protein n=1 Tax=Cyclobacterium qasimii TaxID=1350429 RepID=UPI00147866D2|nr:hypothetical protein [Cyclobacterium qasimii]